MRKRLLIDINSIIPYYIYGHCQGVGRTTLELINAFNNIQKIPFDIILYSQNLKGIKPIIYNKYIKKKHLFFPRRRPFNNILNKLKLKYFMCKYDLMHIPHNTDSCEYIEKTIYTIHDLIVYRYPEMWGLTDKEREEHKFIAKNCKAIVTCSESSKKDIVHFWNVPENKVSVIPWGVNREIFYPDLSTSIIKNLRINPGQYFFCASCNHPRKRLSLLLESYETFLRKGGNSQLVLLKPLNFDYSKYQYLIDRKNMIILDNVDDTTLRQLYSNAKASIMLSLYEGFGLPILESLACHTPVISAKNSSLVEAGGVVIDYIENESANDIALKMIEYDNQNKTNIFDIESIENHLKNFTWEKCAKEYIRFWNKMIN